MSQSPDPGTTPPSPAPAASGSPQAQASAAPKPKNENLLASIVFNIVIPALVLGNLSGAKWLGPAGGLMAALVFPLAYGLYDFHRRRKANFISIVSFAGVLLTGGLGLMKLGGIWFAVKDAAVSSVLGLAVLISMRSREPLVKMLFCNEAVMDMPRVHAALKERGTESGFMDLLRRCTLLVACAFFVSAVLGYWLARKLLRSPAGTEQFNAELAKMHWLSWPVITVPVMILLMVALWRLVVGMKALTGLTMDEIFKGEAEPASKPTAK